MLAVFVATNAAAAAAADGEAAAVFARLALLRYIAFLHRCAGIGEVFAAEAEAAAAVVAEAGRLWPFAYHIHPLPYS